MQRVHHVSTDEVARSIAEGFFREGDLLEPNSPTRPARRAGEMMLRAYNVTYGLHDSHARQQYLRAVPVPGKAGSALHHRALDDRPLPLYGDGMQVRDWLYVDDHCDAIDAVLHRGAPARSTTSAGSTSYTTSKSRASF